ncbi:MAG: alkaline phosphatase family protein [candidate division KSB1 bacterium]|nr:alkaline phosphatase family protein [candidate division KSB1 bacterium]
MKTPPIQNAVIIDIDGLRRDVLYNTLAEDSLRRDANKKLPNLSKIVGNIQLEGVYDPNKIALEKSYGITKCDSLAANHCLTIFPSYTYPAQASIFTGLFPKNHGITANFHFDRAGKSLGADGKSRFYSPFEAMRFYLNEGSCNRMLNKGVITIYDYFFEQGYKCVVSCNLFVSQSTKAVNHVTWHLPWNFEGAGKEIDWLIPNILSQFQFITESGADGIGDYRENFDHKMIEDLLGYLGEHLKFKKAPPNLITLYFGGHDHQAHLQGEVALQRDYLVNTVDVLLGKFLNLWEERAKINPLENTLFVICSDHGHTRAEMDNKKRVTKKELIAAIKKIGYDTLDKSELFEQEQFSNAIINVTAGATHIYVRRGVVKDVRAEWRDHPDFQDLRPILKELSQANQLQSSASNPFSNAFDYILFKDYDQKKYQIYKYDLMNHTDIIKPISKNFGIDQNYVLGKERLEELYSDNSGDILLLVNYSENFRFEQNRRMLSTHGSLVATDSDVPLIFATPYNRRLIKSMAARSYDRGVIPSARIVDIAPTLLHLFKINFQKMDGKILF